MYTLLSVLLVLICLLLITFIMLQKTSGNSFVSLKKNSAPHSQDFSNIDKLSMLLAAIFFCIILVLNNISNNKIQTQQNQEILKSFDTQRIELAVE